MRTLLLHPVSASIFIISDRRAIMYPVKIDLTRNEIYSLYFRNCQ